MSDHVVTPEPAAQTTVSPRRQRQTRILLGAAVVAAIVALAWPRSDGPQKIPAVDLVDAGGRPAPLATRLAPVTLVHFWATWCAPCITEIPTLQGLAADLADRDDFRVAMVAVSDSPEGVVEMLGAGPAGDVLYDDSWKAAHAFGTRQLPETYLVVDGRVHEKFVGAQDWGDPRIRERVALAFTAAAAVDGG
jgi:thiol-disulfide isomerase/thioredoxin